MRISEPYYQEFLGFNLIVHKNVFYPSADTKLLAENIVVNSNDVVLECCAGTGAIALTIANKAKEVYATDISPYCVENIKENTKLFNLNINVFLCDLFPLIDKKYNVIIINPPYTDNEAKDIIEKSYWDKDHETIKKFLAKARNYLTSTGRIYLSWSNFADFNLIEVLFQKYNYSFNKLAESEYKGNVYRVYELTI
jgi:HemK-related putative methylase